MDPFFADVVDYAQRKTRPVQLTWCKWGMTSGFKRRGPGRLEVTDMLDDAAKNVKRAKRYVRDAHSEHQQLAS